MTTDALVAAVHQEVSVLGARLRATEAKLTNERAREALLQMAGFHLDDVKRQFAPLVASTNPTTAAIARRSCRLWLDQAVQLLDAADEAIAKFGPDLEVVE